MATQEASIPELIRTALHDAQDLVRSEIALARAELRAEAQRVRAGVVMLAAAALAGVIGLIFLAATAAWAISEVFGWSIWAGFAIVTAVTLLLAGLLAMAGRSRISTERYLPQTTDTLKEHARWIRARTS